MTTGRIAGALLVLAALSGCATAPREAPEPPLTGTLTLGSGACEGFCPEYEMRVEADDRYRLKAGANTVNPGTHEGALPVGSFRKAVRALEDYGADAMQPRYAPEEPETCPERITGAPLVEIARRADDSRILIAYDRGCLGFADKDRLDQMLARLEAILRIRELVTVGKAPQS